MRYLILVFVLFVSCSKYDSVFRLKVECTQCDLNVFTTGKGHVTYDVNGSFDKKFNSDKLEVRVIPVKGTVSIEIFKNKELCKFEKIVDNATLIICN